jgi:DnaK suppressor protein
MPGTAKKKNKKAQPAEKNQVTTTSAPKTAAKKTASSSSTPKAETAKPVKAAPKANSIKKVSTTEKAVAAPRVRATVAKTGKKVPVKAGTVAAKKDTRPKPGKGGTKPAASQAQDDDVSPAPQDFKPRFSKKELAKIRAQLSNLLDQAQDTIQAEVKSAGDRDLDHIHDSLDIATDSAEGDLAFMMAASRGLDVEEIVRAIEKIDEGSYGYCDYSNRPISLERLKVLPWATKSVKYQELLERRRKSGQGVEDLSEFDDMPELDGDD